MGHVDTITKAMTLTCQNSIITLKTIVYLKSYPHEETTIDLCNKLRYAGVINWLLLSFGHLYMNGVISVRFKEQTSWRHMFKTDWTTS